MVDPVNNPQEALNMIREIVKTASAMDALRLAKGWATMYEGWDVGDADASKYGPRIVVCDEAFRILRPVKIEKDKPLSPFDTFRSEMQAFLRDSLRSFRCLGFHVVLVTQSGRAAEIGSLDGAQDCITYAIIGAQKSRSMSEQLIGTGDAFKNSRLQKGVFLLDEGGRTIMFRAPYDAKPVGKIISAKSIFPATEESSE